MFGCRTYEGPFFHIAACNVYISEGRDGKIIQKLNESVQNDNPSDTQRASLAHVFVDASYNRTGFTLIGSRLDAVVHGVLQLSKTALSLIDLREHDATHPRLGVVDHISCHPLEDGGMGGARDCAVAIAKGLGDGIGIPTYLYGTASRDAAQLSDIRRHFGYFKPDTSGKRNQGWSGAIVASDENAVIETLSPSFGPHKVRPEWGIACVGSVPWVTNHNVVLATKDLAIAKHIARMVSERGGGLPAVQAMGLEVQGAVEVACNLLDSSQTNTDMVDDLISKLGRDIYGVEIERSYQTGKTKDQLVDLLSNKFNK